MGELIDKLKGKLKRIEGELTGDRAKQAEGAVDELKGDVKGAFEDAKHAVKQAVREAKEDRVEKDGEAETDPRR